MKRIDITGAGAFGSALAIALSRGGRDVMLWARDAVQADAMRRTRAIPRLPGVSLPETVSVTQDLTDLTADIRLLAVPMQALSGHLALAPPAPGTALVACCKGIDLSTGKGPTGVIADGAPDAKPAILTGPSFAADIARGLPTALTLACRDIARGVSLQHALATDTLRIYRSSDPTGAELGGALKNVVAIAAGLVIGAGLGESARAALMTRGFVEMQRFAEAMGAEPETLLGLSGFGDMVLTATSAQSRNFAFGQALGAGTSLPEGTTVEGRATARAVARIASEQGLDMPICTMVSAVLGQSLTVREAMETLLARELREE
ncbi:MAG: NAD(P)H-dependent glycerol-3-phosphate dehydrogenase [Dinoroseobacter sp.]|nr:NAD(P)H-dependent glycerol-3-phosphate dehydrogenase [Dinoroseobacter sp.]